LTSPSNSNTVTTALQTTPTGTTGQNDGGPLAAPQWTGIGVVIAIITLLAMIVGWLWKKNPEWLSCCKRKRNNAQNNTLAIGVPQYDWKVKTSYVMLYR
jgi:hypothetical protein